MATPLTNTDLFTQVLAILNAEALSDGQALLKGLRLGLRLWAQQQLDELNAEKPPNG
jgi:hypothetical protein